MAALPVARPLEDTAPLHWVMVPGWHGSAPDHWQHRWPSRLGRAVTVEQEDWERPTVAAWVAGLGQALAGLPGPKVLVAHSLGCITLAHWAARGGADDVLGALLVAPADVERPAAPAPLRAFAPIPRRRLPFPSLLIASSNDPAARPERAAGLAAAWGSRFICLKGAGHINAASGHHDWDEGLELLRNWTDSLQRPAGAYIA